MENNVTIRKLNDLHPVLMDQSLSGETEVYYVVSVNSKNFGLEPNVTLIPPGRLGKEYPKTFGHYHHKECGETYRILYGEGIVLMQKTNKGGEILEVVAQKVATGDEVSVPVNYGHCLINSSDDLLVVADWESDKAGHDYDPIEKKRGMAYYCVEENGKTEFRKNENYREVSPLVVR